MPAEHLCASYWLRLAWVYGSRLLLTCPLLLESLIFFRHVCSIQGIPGELFLLGFVRILVCRFCESCFVVSQFSRHYMFPLNLLTLNNYNHFGCCRWAALGILRFYPHPVVSFNLYLQHVLPPIWLNVRGNSGKTSSICSKIYCFCCWLRERFVVLSKFSK